MLREAIKTLWDLLEPARNGKPEAVRTPAKRASRAVRPPRRASRRERAQDRYDRVVRDMLAKYNVRVRRWRRSMSGCAWTVEYRDGTVVRLIESPRPTGPMSAAIFLHEIGHHALGVGSIKPRCLEEYHAWKFAIDQMEALGLGVTEAVRRRMHRSLHYAIGKAARRKLKALPAELEPFLAEPPPRATRRTRGTK